MQSSWINLSSLPPSNSISLNLAAPVAVTINPAKISVPSKVYKISYDFGDGTTFDRNLQVTSYGSPLSTVQTHFYYLKNSLSQTLTINVNVYCIAASVPQNYTITLNLSAPPLESSIFNLTSSLSTQGFFDEFHLIGTRMFGPNNDILYTFESINSNYLIPALVNWEARPVINKTSITINNARPYRLLAPFESEINTSINTGTNILTIAPVPGSNTTDNGSQFTNHHP